MIESPCRRCSESRKLPFCAKDCKKLKAVQLEDAERNPTCTWMKREKDEAEAEEGFPYKNERGKHRMAL